MQRADDLAVEDGDDEELPGIAVEELEGAQVVRQVAVRRRLARPSQLVVGEQGDHGRDVAPHRGPERHRSAGDRQGRQIGHPARPLPAATRSASASTWRQASAQASAHSPNARSKNECGAPS